jgi:hypothetical protein
MPGRRGRESAHATPGPNLFFIAGKPSEKYYDNRTFRHKGSILGVADYLTDMRKSKEKTQVVDAGWERGGKS